MSKPATVKRKLKLLNSPGTASIIYDAIAIYIMQVRGEGCESEELVLTVTEILKEVDKEYRSQLPVQKVTVKNRDLEELIESVKSGKEK